MGTFFLSKITFELKTCVNVCLTFNELIFCSIKLLLIRIDNVLRSHFYSIKKLNEISFDDVDKHVLGVHRGVYTNVY